MSLRILAIDWSGAKNGAKRTIWLAEVVEGCIAGLERGRDRAAIVEHLDVLRGQGEELVVGIDFAFSLPEWYVRSHGAAAGPELWDWLAEGGRAERLLEDCQPPFWGRPGKPRPPMAGDPLRSTDAATRAGQGIAPKSVFQIGGAGAVGTGSLRGMVELRRLRAAGFAIWPFDDPRLPLVVEIYPRALTGPVVKSRADARREHLRKYRDRMPRSVLDAAERSEDAFDAAASALVMWDQRRELLNLPPVSDERLRLEGIIWQPRWRERHGV